MTHLNPDFPYPAGHKPASEPVEAPRIVLGTAATQSDRWVLAEESDYGLVVSRAALRHMLGKIEQEMGNRKLMPPQRGTR